MTLLRSLGSRLRRDENVPENDMDDLRHDSYVNAMPDVQKPRRGHGINIPAGMNVNMNMNVHMGIHGHGGEPPDLYYEDRELGEAVRALEGVRETLASVTQAAGEHKEMLASAASSQRFLGETLCQAIDARPGQEAFSGDRGGGDNFSDLGLGGGGGGGGAEEDEEEGTVATFLSLENVDSIRTLGNSFVGNSAAVSKLGIAFFTPINDLQNSFEERFARKIVPLRKRYSDQKGQYLKYMRMSDAAEEEEKRSYYDALAQAAKPVWVRTSKELRMEASVMTQLTSRNIAKWSKGLALQHERGLAIAAANFSDSFTKAKALSK